MNISALAAQWFGALVLTYLLTRLANWVMRRCGVMRPWGWSHLVVAIFAVVAGAFGGAGGGPLAWEWAATLYLPTTALWLWFDYFAEKRRRQRQGIEKA